MMHKHLKALPLIAIDSELASTLDFGDIVDDFA